ncbi:MAG: nitroreductase family protein [Desulfuromonadaceae bacterium]
MELFQAIKERYSYRGAFVQKPLPEADLRKIVQAGLDAPSGKNLQTTQFIIIDDPEKLDRVRGVFAGQAFITTAQAFIALFYDIEEQAASEFPYTFEVEDAAAAVQNILLAITGLGYASVWLDGVLRNEQRAERIGEIVGLPKSKRIRILLPVGVPTDENHSRKEKLAFDKRVWFNTWQPA